MIYVISHYEDGPISAFSDKDKANDEIVRLLQENDDFIYSVKDKMSKKVSQLSLIEIKESVSLYATPYTITELELH